MYTIYMQYNIMYNVLYTLLNDIFLRSREHNNIIIRVFILEEFMLPIMMINISN